MRYVDIARFRRRFKLGHQCVYEAHAHSGPFAHLLARIGVSVAVSGWQSVVSGEQFMR